MAYRDAQAEKITNEDWFDIERWRLGGAYERLRAGTGGETGQAIHKANKKAPADAGAFEFHREEISTSQPPARSS